MQPSLIISVHVVQWLEHLAGYQKVTDYTHIHNPIHHLSPCNSMVRASPWLSEGYTLYTCM